MAANRIASIITREATKSCTGSVIVLHGTGDSGSGLQAWIESELRRKWEYHNNRLIFPSAAPMFSTSFQCEANVWFDRKSLEISVPEVVPSIDVAVTAVSAIIEGEVEKGIPRNRIIVGGFSQGASLALHVGYRKFTDLAGVFALSGFLNDNSVVYQSLSETKGSSYPPLFQCHGTDDNTVRYDWGKETHKQLTSSGVKGTFHTVEGIQHELHRATLLKLDAWIQRLLS